MYWSVLKWKKLTELQKLRKKEIDNETIEIKKIGLFVLEIKVTQEDKIIDEYCSIEEEFSEKIKIVTGYEEM